MVIGMSRRDSRRKYKKRGKRKNQIFLVMMTILACTVAIVLTVKMNNKNVSKGVAVGAEYTAIKSDGNVTEEQLSVSEETVNDLPDVYRIECYESLNQNPELPKMCIRDSFRRVTTHFRRRQQISLLHRREVFVQLLRLLHLRSLTQLLERLPEYVFLMVSR